MTLAEIFKDGMIVQAGKPFRVFGTGEGAGRITWLGCTKEVSAADGVWMTEFPAADYGGPYTLAVQWEDRSETLVDLYVGEVLLFSGQSNVQFHMKDEATPPEDYRDDPMLRIFVSQRMEAGETIFPQDGWVPAKRENIDGWSALAYLTGRRLRESGCPAVGVIACSQGASVIQSWMPADEITGTELDLPRDVLYGDHHYAVYQTWNGYGTLYQFMLTRLLPYCVGAVVWYQGESNASPAEGEIYDKLLARLIESWRRGFDDPTLPFIVVQLADFDGNTGIGWKRVQQKQMEAAREIPYVRTVPCADICETNNIHPPTKSRLAERICENLHF